MSNALQTASGQPTELSNTETDTLAFVNPNELPDLDAAEVGMRIEQKYYEFIKEGDTVRAVYNGMKSIVSKKNDETKLIPAIVFQNKEGVFLNSGASLVEQLSNLPPGTPVEIKFLGKEKTKSGNYVNKFDVRVLNVKVNAHLVQTSAKQLKPSEVTTAYWEKAYAMGFTEQDGKDHLSQFNNDFKAALDALTNDEVPF